jgi:uncharacterized protein (DUF2252 family)
MAFVDHYAHPCMAMALGRQMRAKAYHAGAKYVAGTVQKQLSLYGPIGGCHLSVWHINLL